MPKGEPSLADRAYRMLRRDLLAGEFAPGQPLRLGMLSARYDLSFSPIREALTRLAADRLVILSSLRGFRVAEISTQEMWDIISTRILVESEALRRSIAWGDETWEGGIVGAFHALSRLSSTAPPSDPDLVEMRHMTFHRALIAACGSPSLLDIAERYYTQSEWYRRPTLVARAGARTTTRDVMAEHREIMERALARDADAAVEALARHYRRTGDSIETILTAHDPAQGGARAG
ncbi:FCD domain-containing protein [Cribrihabitans sp. XS_ASV171]